jgi:hypothetical protein
MAPPILPFINGIYEWLAEDNDDNEVITAQGLLGLLGYGRKEHPSCLADSRFFDDVRQFQKDNGLKVDGVITPRGETVQTMDRLLSEEIKKWQDVDDSYGESEKEKKCAFNLLKFDLPTCEGARRFKMERAKRLRGRAAKAAKDEANRSFHACESEAYNRYSWCMTDERKLDTRPPINMHH